MLMNDMRRPWGRAPAVRIPRRPFPGDERAPRTGLGDILAHRSFSGCLLAVLGRVVRASTPLEAPQHNGLALTGPLSWPPRGAGLSLDPPASGPGATPPGCARTPPPGTPPGTAPAAGGTPARRTGPGSGRGTGRRPSRG